MSSAELTEWAAYEQISGPLGPERMDVLLASLTATVANTARGKGQRAKEPGDFMPTWDQGAPARGGDWQQMLTTVTSLNRRLRGRDARGGRGDA
ncbi:MULTISPECIES: hypothetical protein [unclassified Streptomyces]|uniref:phage tail assembly protein T n=1 Tax=unclassified Streptomyces TaxID=2593676 RepID=UPI001EEF9F79|nr:MULTISPECIES: hypothetical protein [unclassified Streptomyces]